MTEKYFSAAMTATGFLTAAISGRANAEILPLDCSNENGMVVEHIWVDMDQSSVTEGFANGAVPAACPAQITATTIHRGYGGRVTYDATIDRITGTFRANYGGVAFGSATVSCTKGSTPFPATKF